MALFPVRTNPRWRPPPSWIISNGHISQQLTIYLYSAHRAVIVAIAQLSWLNQHHKASVLLSTVFCMCILSQTEIQNLI